MDLIGYNIGMNMYKKLIFISIINMLACFMLMSCTSLDGESTRCRYEKTCNNDNCIQQYIGPGCDRFYREWRYR